MQRPHQPVSRFVSVDLLRGVAILGMLWAHSDPIAPVLLPERLNKLLSMVSGAATPLFMLVAGNTIAILAQGLYTAPMRRRFRLEYLLRGVLLIVLGLVVLQWSMRIDIVLPYIGATFIAAVPFLFLRARWLLVGALVCFAAAPVIAALMRSILNATPELLHSAVSNHPVVYLMEWFFTGRAYHATWLLPFLLLGIALGRNLLSARWSFSWLVPAGIAVLAGYWLTTRGIEDSLRVRGDHAELFFDLGRALIVYGVVAALTSARFPRLRQLVYTVGAPVTLVGRMPLTIYAMHVLVIAAMLQSSLTDPPITAAAALLSLGILFGSAFNFSALWSLTLGVGPIERVLGVASLRHPPVWALRVKPVTKHQLGLSASERLDRTLKPQRADPR